MDPGTAMLIASAINAGIQGGGMAMKSAAEKKAAKRKAKEMKRETYAENLNQTLDRSAELKAHELGSRSKMGKKRAESFDETSDLVRRAFNI